jgi:hypothetical protein
MSPKECGSRELNTGRREDQWERRVDRRGECRLGDVKDRRTVETGRGGGSGQVWWS